MRCTIAARITIGRDGTSRRVTSTRKTTTVTTTATATTTTTTAATATATVTAAQRNHTDLRMRRVGVGAADCRVERGGRSQCTASPGTANVDNSRVPVSS
ncbi:hypothetical protein PUN28_015414 [Cardiocondyla obscurior]|uniref:Uncharacterized protein n=1 Tax=Cardiocondyla obscurior TaxID=286306 RepID=A0AAW2EY74_9HYME